MTPQSTQSARTTSSSPPPRFPIQWVGRPPASTEQYSLAALWLNGQRRRTMARLAVAELDLRPQYLHCRDPIDWRFSILCVSLQYRLDKTPDSSWTLSSRSLWSPNTRQHLQALHWHANHRAALSLSTATPPSSSSSSSVFSFAERACMRGPFSALPQYMASRDFQRAACRAMRHTHAQEGDGAGVQW